LIIPLARLDDTPGAPTRHPVPHWVLLIYLLTVSGQGFMPEAVSEARQRRNLERVTGDSAVFQRAMGFPDEFAPGYRVAEDEERWLVRPAR
tara:strand:+ start:492 stop:764 length:273 start_codon:yes stop_codon:yes gene_type:complete